MSPDDPSHSQVLAGEEPIHGEDLSETPETGHDHPTEPREQVTPYDHLWYRRRPQE